MKQLLIYDPAMCCSSGVCGTNVDQELVKLASFINKLDKASVSVERYNLGQQPEAYASNGVVALALKNKGTDALPMVFINNQIITSGSYPSIEELTKLLDETPANETEFPSSSCCGGGCCS